MPCLAAPHLPDVSAAIALLLPTLSFSIPPLGVSFCCSVEAPAIPGFPIIIPLGVLIPAGGAALIISAMALINSTIDQLNALLDQLTVSCPLD